MRDIRWPPLRVSALALLILLAGCGTALSTNPSGLSPTPAAQFSPTPSAAATPGGNGHVTLHTDALLYQPGATITVTLSNGSTHSISFPDHLTNCTVILLQRTKAQPKAANEGVDIINPCRLASPTRLHTLGPGQQLIVPLAAPKGGWPPGRYLATLGYRLSLESGLAMTISSPAFVVGASGPQP